MKLCFDECLSQRIAESFAVFFKNEHVITHTRSKFVNGIKDIQQIEELSQEGGWVFISLDKKITKNKAEQRAIRSANMVSFFLSGSLNKSGTQKQFQRLINIWDDMIKIASENNQNTIFTIPQSGTIKPMKLK